MKNYLCDTNILVTIIEDRPGVVEIRNLLRGSRRFVSVKSVATACYLCRKNVTVSDIESVLETFEVLGCVAEGCHWAMTTANNINDVEDCMEVSLAARHGLELLTADKELVAKYGEHASIVLV